MKLENISSGYEGENFPVFSGFTLTINPGDRIGVVGPNGAGKSTLLKAITGQLELYKGVIYKTETIGYLPQIQDPNQTILSLFDSQLSNPLAILEKYYSAFTFDTSSGGEMTPNDHAIYIEGLNQQIEFLDAYNAYPKIEAALTRLGIGDIDLNRDFGTFSGGEQARILFALATVTDPQIILLDEPTNNLDIQGKLTLQKALANFKGAVVAVSHDRYFLDAACKQIVEFDGLNEHPMIWNGNYTDFVEQKEKFIEKLASDIAAQDKYLARIKSEISRLASRSESFNSISNDAAQRSKSKKIASQVKSRRKRLEHLQSSLEWRKERKQAQAFKLAFVSTIERRSFIIPSLKFTTDFGLTVECRGLTARTGNTIAIIGHNGIGKSLYIKALVGELSKVESLKIGYLPQSPDDLISDVPVVEYFRNIAMPCTEDEAIGMIKSKGFHIDEARKPMKLLSPGERLKIHLTALAYSDYEIIILDEPTNHLDIDALGNVEESLKDYNGLIIVVSHDMYFLEAIKTSDVILFTSNGENHTTGELSQLQNLIETGRSPNIPHTEGGQTLGVFR